MASVSLLCFFASYLVALVVEVARWKWDHAALRWGGWAAIAAGLTAQTIYLAVRSRSVEMMPLLASPHDWLLGLAWLLVATLVVLARFLPQIALGSYLLPPAIGIIAVAWFVDADPKADPLRENGGWVLAHSLILVLGFVGVILAFVSSLMYLRQHRRLKRREPLASGARLLDLETLARWNWWAVMGAAPLITIGFAMGAALSLASDQAAAAVPLRSMPMVLMAVLWLGLVGLMVWLLTQPRAGGTAVAVRTAWACGFVLLIVLSLTLLGPDAGLHGMPAPSAVATGDAA